LAPAALFAFVDLLGGTASSLNTFWIFGVTAALAGYAGVVAGIRFQLLAGSIAVIISWSALWNKLLGDEGIAGHFGVYRGLLGILAIGLLAGALYLWRENPGPDEPAATATDAGGDAGLWKASELLTGAGIAAILGCSLGAAGQAAQSGFPLFGNLPGTSVFWDALLLVIALGLVALGSTMGVRGPVYVGAIGLVVFLLLVGLDLDDGGEAASEQKIGIWPIVVLVLGALAVALSAVKEASQGEKPRQLVAKLKGK
jgi:hypothetical protein